MRSLQQWLGARLQLVPAFLDFYVLAFLITLTTSIPLTISLPPSLPLAYLGFVHHFQHLTTLDAIACTLRFS